MRSSLLISAFIAAKIVSAADCNKNNCLRQIIDARYSAKASSFCATYTTTVNADPSAIPTYLGNCNQLPSAVSSACSCLVTSTPTTVASSTITTTATSASLSSTITASATLDCHANNCARALRNPLYSDAASDFCGTYTASCNNDLAAIPTYLGNCGGSPVSISSACSCFVPAPTPTSYSNPSFAPEKCGTTGPASGSSKSNYLLECGQSYDKSLAASTITAASSDDCLDACDSQSGCAAITYDETVCQNNCYLFGSLSGLTTTTSATSDSAAFACAALIGPDPSTCDTVLAGANPFKVQCGLSYVSDGSLGVSTQPGYTECYNSCASNSKCSAFSFDSSICSNNCKLLAFTDDLTTTWSDSVSSGFTPGNARDYSCGSAICGTSANGMGSNGDGYLVACRSSYSFSQDSDISGSPFTATSFKDCLKQCDDNDYCNYMSFDSSKFDANCAMFSRNGVSVDILTADPNIDSAKALVNQQGGTTGDLSPAIASCPKYTSTTGKCSSGTLTPYHFNIPPSEPIYKYGSSCGTTYTASRTGITSTLTVNTYLQCLDACDKNNHCGYMTFTKSSVAVVDNCHFIYETWPNTASLKRNTPNFDSAYYSYYTYNQ